jgi:hypothetical protein
LADSALTLARDGFLTLFVGAAFISAFGSAFFAASALVAFFLPLAAAVVSAGFAVAMIVFTSCGKSGVDQKNTRRG